MIKAAAWLLAALLVVSFVIYRQQQHGDAEQTAASCAPLTVSTAAVAAVETVGGVFHDLTTKNPTSDAIARDTLGVLDTAGTILSAGLARTRGEERPESVSQFEARAVSVRQASAAACAPCPTVGVQPANTPNTEVAGYDAVQLANAAAIVNAGAAMGVSQHGQTVAVMTALGESSLRVLDHGDQAGPDSRGLFQQRDNGAWGSYADRMDPATSATNFYRALLAVEGWETLPPTEAAHRTQRNADPSHYERYWPAAGEVVAATTGRPAETSVVQAASAPPDPTATCAGAGVVQTASGPAPSVGSFVMPVSGRVSSEYGYRIHPVYGERRLHKGMDIAASCGTPVKAAQSGVVESAGVNGGYGNIVVVQHTGGLSTGYAHLESMSVQPGATVAQGQTIGRVGTTGTSTGCHLHYEVREGGEPVNPRPYRPTEV